MVIGAKVKITRKEEHRLAAKKAVLRGFPKFIGRD